ncbi:hypothetical protein OPQ81_002800 [Rhizoctonia solani]|nr:hypothetical protein OPQ81_002800 [Rhizoctonia solani]
MSELNNSGNALNMSTSTNGSQKMHDSVARTSTSSTSIAGVRLPSTSDLFRPTSYAGIRPGPRSVSSLKSTLPPPSEPESPVSDRQAANPEEQTLQKQSSQPNGRPSHRLLANSNASAQAEAKIAELTESLAAARSTIVALGQQSSPTQPGTPTRSTIVPALRAQINELTARIERRTEQIGIHQHEIKRLEAHLGLTQDTVQELQEDLDQAGVRERALLEDATLAREERDAARQALAEGQFSEAEYAEEQTVALVHSIFDAIGHARSNKRTAEAYRDKLDTQVQQTRALQIQADQRAAELDLLMTQVDGVNARMSALRQELQTEQQRLAEEKARADKAEQRAEEAEQLAEAAKFSADEDKNWAEDYRKKLEVAQCELAESKQHLSELEAKLADVESAREELEACEAVLVGLREELEAEKTNGAKGVAEVQAALDEKQVELTRKTGELDALRDEFVRTAAELDTRTAELASKTAELDTLRMELETKTNELQYKDVQYGQLKSDHAALQSCLQAIQSSFDTKKADYESLNANNQTLQSEFESLQSGYDAKQVEFRSLQSGFSALQCEMEAKDAELQRLNAALESSANGAEVELKAVREELQAARDALTQSQQELESVRSELVKSTEIADVAGVEKSVMAGELRAAREQLGELRARIGELEALIQGGEVVKAELASLKEQLENATIERANFEQQLATAQQQHETLQRQNVEMKLALEAGEARVALIQSQLDDVEMRAPASEMDELRAKIGSMTEQLAEMETLRAQVAEVEDLRIQVAELEDIRAQVTELERLLVEAQAGTQNADEVSSLRARVEELDKLRERAEEELCGRLEDMKHLEAHVGALEEEVRAMASLREEMQVLQQTSRDQQSLISELQNRPASGNDSASSDALERLQEQYDMVLQDAKRMTAEVEGYDDKLLEVLKREKKLELKVGNLTRKLRATQAKLDAAKAAQAVPPTTGPSQVAFAEPAPDSMSTLTSAAPPRSPKRTGSNTSTSTGTSSLFTQSASSVTTSIFNSSGSSATAKFPSLGAGNSKLSNSVPVSRLPQSPSRSPARPAVPDFGPKLAGSINPTGTAAPATGTGRTALRPLPIFSAQPATASLAPAPTKEPSKTPSATETNSRKRPIPDEFSTATPGTHVEVAMTTPRTHLRFKTLSGTGAAMNRKGFTPSGKA